MTDLLKLTSLTLNDRQLCDIELILNGGFLPLKGFLNKKNYLSVCNDMKLTNGSIWPMPITLDVSKKMVDEIGNSTKIVLRDKEGFALAKLNIEDIWIPDRNLESEQVFGTTDLQHPGANYLLNESNEYYIGGELELISLPEHYDYKINRHSPKELKKIFNKLGWNKIVAFQTRNPMHKAHYELTKYAMKCTGDENAIIFLNPVVGVTQE